MKTFINQLYRRLSGLDTITVLLIMLGARPQLHAQGMTSGTSKNRITGILTDEKSQPIAFCQVNLISLPDYSTVKELLTNEKGIYTIVGVPAGSYLIRAEAFGSFETAGSSSFLITSKLNSVTVPDLKMEIKTDQNSTPLKYWQADLSPFAGQNESIPKDGANKFIPEKYWRTDWFNNLP